MKTEEEIVIETLGKLHHHVASMKVLPPMAYQDSIYECFGEDIFVKAAYAALVLRGATEGQIKQLGAYREVKNDAAAVDVFNSIVEQTGE